jgi:hypothetical protein
VERLGYLGEFFQATAHQPEVLLAFHQFSEAGKGALGPRLSEVVALTAARIANNDYELNQHERLCVHLGFGRAWVSTVERLEPDAAEDLTPEEREVQHLTLALLDDLGHGATEALDAVARNQGSDLAVAVLFVAGRHLVHSLIVNALGLPPPVPSVFQDGDHGD